MKEKDRTRVSEQWLGEDGIAYLVFKEGAEIELEDAVKIVQYIELQYPESKFPVLVDVSCIQSISHEARTFLADTSARKISFAVAILVGSTSSTLFGNFFMRFHKPLANTRLFKDKEEAARWLKASLPVPVIHIPFKAQAPVDSNSH
ncbi:MAG: hypothetical protein ACHQRM_04505 [Bacteroidia bacterium]